MNNVICMKGVPTPKYRTQKMMQDRDQDLFVRMLDNHPAHLQRSKEKARQHIEAYQRKVQEEARAKKADEDFTLFLGGLSVSSMLALMLAIAL